MQNNLGRNDALIMSELQLQVARYRGNSLHAKPERIYIHLVFLRDQILLNLTEHMKNIDAYNM